MAYAFNNDKTRAEIIDLIYPVGSIYMSVNNTNPSNFIGGTWVAWGAGKVPVGVNANDSDFNAAEKTGGEKTHTLTAAEMPKHTHTGPSHTHGYTMAGDTTGSTTLNVSQIPAHTHTFKRLAAAANSAASGTQKMSVVDLTGDLNTGSTGGSKGHTHTMPSSAKTTGSGGAGSTGSAGSDIAHNIMQPYITCYMWKRTA